MHLGHGLASYATAALPVRLRLGEEDSPPRQSTLLQHPAPLVKMAVENVVVKPINVLAHIKQRPCLFNLCHNVLSLAPRSQKPIMLIISQARSKNAVYSAKHSLYLFSLRLKIAIRSLDDADQVNPEIALAKGASNAHYITESSRQRANSNANLMLLKV